MKKQTIKLSNSVYEGEVKNGKPNGKGTFTKFYDGVPIDKYIGEFKNGKRDGKGKSYDIKIELFKSKPPEIKKKFIEQLSYVGEFKNDQWDGKGTFIDYGEDLYYLGKSFDKIRVKGDRIIAILDCTYKNGELNGEGKIMVYYNKPGGKQKLMKTYEGIFIENEGKVTHPPLSQKEILDQTLQVRMLDDLIVTGTLLSRSERENLEKNLDNIGGLDHWKSNLGSIKKELNIYDKEELKEKMTSGEIIDELPKKSVFKNLIKKITKKNK